MKLFNNLFNELFIEESINDHFRTKEILSKIRCDNSYIIKNYQSFFNRNRQNFQYQKNSRKLILARKEDNFILDSSPYCYNFGFENFFYITPIINCIFDCEYCFLQGMYNSANIICFVNFEDFFKKINNINKRSLFAVSYVSDILALEYYFNFFFSLYHNFNSNNNKFFEIRTKSANPKPFLNIKPVDNFFISISITANSIHKRYENYTPDILTRINFANELLKFGWKVNLCIEPFICISDDIYSEYLTLVDIIKEKPNFNKINKIVISEYKLPLKYYKNIIKRYPIPSFFKDFNFESTEDLNFISINNKYINLLKEYILKYTIEDKITIG